MKNINKREKIIADRDKLEERERQGAGADRLNSRGRDTFKRIARGRKDTGKQQKNFYRRSTKNWLLR